MAPSRDIPAHAAHGGASFEALGTDFSRLDRKGEIVNADVLDAWYDPSPKVVAAIAEHLPWLLRTSPPTHADGLRRAVAEARGLPLENVMVGAGSSTLAYMAMPHIAKPGDRVHLLDPSYGEYAHLLEVVHGMRCQRSTLRPENGFRPEIETILREISSADIVLLVNPNSPTGTRFTREEVGRILAALPRFGALVVDETYVDFAPDDTSVETWVSEHENLYVLKSLSKFFALSGARAGYIAGPASFIEKLESASPPWSVSLIAQVAVIEALRDVAYYRQKADETRALREALAASLGQIPGLKVHGSVANFLMLELLGDVTSARVVADCAELGVFLRDCDDQGRSLGGRFIRTAVKDAVGNERIVAALRECVPAQAELAAPAHAELAAPAHAELAAPAHAELAVREHAEIAVPASAEIAVPEHAEIAVREHAEIAVRDHAELMVPPPAKLLAPEHPAAAPPEVKPEPQAPPVSPPAQPAEGGA